MDRPREEKFLTNRLWRQLAQNTSLAVCGNICANVLEKRSPSRTCTNQCGRERPRNAGRRFWRANKREKGGRSRPLKWHVSPRSEVLGMGNCNNLKRTVGGESGTIRGTSLSRNGSRFCAKKFAPTSLLEISHSDGKCGHDGVEAYRRKGLSCPKATNSTLNCSADYVRFIHLICLSR
jgi:hypothetical protein